MAGKTVSGSVLGLSSATPTGLTAESTKAQIITAYEALNYTFAQSCIITQMPKFEEFWETKDDEKTACADDKAIQSKYKTVQKVSDASISAILEKSDPLIILFMELRKSRDQVGTLQLTSKNGDVVWAQIEVSKTDEDHTEIDGKVKFMAEFFFKAKPERN